MNLTMRGLCNGDTKLMEGFFDVVYFIQGFERQKAHWRGEGKSHIFYKRRTKSWRLESFYDSERFAELAADDSVPRAFYPLGRNIWKARIYNSTLYELGGCRVQHPLLKKVLTSHT